LTGLKEPESINPELKRIRESVPVTLKEILAKSKQILKNNTGYRNFIIVDALIQLTLSASAFYPVYAVSKFDLPASYAGTFTIIFMASQVFGNFIFGYLADYFGHKINILILALFSAAASITAVLSNNVLIYGAVFFFVGSVHTLQAISRVAFVVEMCSEAERPVYIGLLNTVTAPMVLFGVIAGTMITITGFIPVFLIYASISLTAVYRLHKYVDEPRKIKNLT
jgi:MFS family permease